MGLLSAGVLPAFARLLSGPLAVDSSVTLAAGAAIAALVSAAKEDAGATPSLKLDSAGLAALSAALARVLSRHASASSAGLAAIGFAVAGVAEASEAAAGSFAGAGGVDYLVDALGRRLGNSNPHAVIAICEALEAVTAYRKPVALAAAASALHPVSAVIFALAAQPPQQPDVVRALTVACGIVANVGVDDGAAEQFVSTGGAAALIGAVFAQLHLRDPRNAGASAAVETVVDAACRALYSLKSFPRGRSTLAAAGAANLLREALAAFPHNASIADSAHWALQALLIPERRLSAGAVVPLVR